MKKFIIALLLATIAFTVPQTEVKAQSVYTTTKSISAADTVTFTTVYSNVRAFQYTYTETSGTTAGKVYLEGTISGGVWFKVDSLTLSDVATAQSFVVAVSRTAGTTYKSYRFRNTNTSSASGSVIASYMRRSDE